MDGIGFRRRMVQSTLFPHRDSSVKEGENCGLIQIAARKGSREEEEDCGRREKRKEAKRKPNPKIKSSPPYSSQKVKNNGQKTSRKLEDFDDSSTTVSGKSTPEKPKRQYSTTPTSERNSTPSKKTKVATRKICSSQIPYDLTLDEEQSQAIPNLRLEAKLTAEENSRIFTGKQIHPFFTSWKSGKNNQELTGSDSQLALFEKKEKGISFNPIHVFENVKEDCRTLDWGHWRFPERSISENLDCQFSLVYEGSVESLNFDNYLSGLHLTQSSLHPDSHPSSIQLKDVDKQLFDRGEIPASSVQKPSTNHTNENYDLFAGKSKFRNLDSELQERIMSHYSTSQSQPENCLWTDKYQPQKIEQICGNGEAVKFLSQWLHFWQKMGSAAGSGCINNDIYINQDDDYDCLQSDCESDTVDDDESLKNVLLVSGPVGSGKSAAIYACAKEHGFQIIEINASDWRSGALVKQKFGEAVESHLLQRTVENPVNADTKTGFPDNEVVEITPLTNMEDFQNGDTLPNKIISGDNLTDSCQNEIKTLILFEDVDANLCEDQGFISTIQQLAETAKRPMILTSNSHSPVLPKNLDRSELRFSLPSLRDLLRHVGVICAAEKVKIHPFLVERFVDHCQGDIRKTIMLLQFWCHGQDTKRGNKFVATYNPVNFDIDAAHQIFPKMIHWGYPSQLSESVFKEVVNSLVLREETGINSEELNDNRTENIHRHSDELDPFVVKKEAMLSLHSSHPDEADYTRFDANLQLFDSSCSPVAFGRQNRRRKVNTVLSSDSEDELLGGSSPLDSGGLMDVDIELLASHCLPIEIGQLPTEPICCSSVDKLEELRLQISEGVDTSRMDCLCKSIEMSCVPESSFVPETELIDDADLYSAEISYVHFTNVTAANVIVQDSSPAVEPSVGPKFNQPLPIIPADQDSIGNYSETGLYQEEVGESLSQCDADVPREYQVLDECSCVDFLSRLKSFDNYPKTDHWVDSIQESWNRLRNQCKDFRNYVTEEEKFSFKSVKIAHCITDIISNSDLLLNDCQTELFDFLGPSKNLYEKAHSYTFLDDHLEMSSIIAQHGMCFYAKEIASLGSITGSAISLDLTSEMLSSSQSSIALGKLVRLDQKMVETCGARQPRSSSLLTCKSDSHVRNILDSVVPLKSNLSVKGKAFHEYLSTLCQISRFETSRLSESIGKNKLRRSRVPRHYLSSGPSTMSSEEISFLEEYNTYTMDPSLRDLYFR